MKVTIKEQLTFFGFWAACVGLIFFTLGCKSPELSSDDSDTSTSTGPVVGAPDSPPQGLPEDTSPVTLPLGFLETDCGHNISDNACDFNLLDQYDNPWRLSDHLGDVVLLDLSAMWCAPCQAAAQTAQTTQDEFGDKGFHYVTILIVDSQNDAVDVADAHRWASSFGIQTAPVLQGSRDLLVSGGASHGYPLTSWPTFIFLNRTHDVAYGIYGFNEEWIRREIESLL
jgi:thiol-disulfide isomerase/thioredoxin|tara:strand:- start:19 stop:699 length:681 start_codon:yes stop_codon:yes gene_type:complete